MTKREELIEAMARAMCQDTLERHGACYDECERTGKCCGQDISIPDAQAALTALETALGIDLTAIAEGRVVCVPVEPPQSKEGQNEIWFARHLENANYCYRAMVQAGAAALRVHARGKERTP